MADNAEIIFTTFFAPLMNSTALQVATIVVLLLSGNQQHAQTSRPLSESLVPQGEIVVRQPLNPIAYKEHWLIADDTVTHDDDRYGYKPFAAIGLSTRTLTELINNQRIDTSAWQTKEFPTAVLVTERLDQIPIHETIKQFNLSDQAIIKKISKRIRRFNNILPEDRYLYQVSRPVFDLTSHYAAVIREHSGSETGQLLIFERKADGWHMLGIPKRWAY